MFKKVVTDRPPVRFASTGTAGSMGSYGAHLERQPKHGSLYCFKALCVKLNDTYVGSLLLGNSYRSQLKARPPGRRSQTLRSTESKGGVGPPCLRQVVDLNKING